MRLARLALVSVCACLLTAGPAAAAPQNVLAASYAVPTPPTTAVAGTTLQVQVQIANSGDEPWISGGIYPVNLTYHWYDGAGAAVIWDGARTPLGADPVLPLGKRDVTATVVAPAQPGQYTLRFALVREGVAWFAPSAPLAIAVQAASFVATYQPATPPA